MKGDFKQNCLLIAGEKSGEEHAMSFVSDILKRIPELDLWGVGGDLLSEKGMNLIYHLNAFSSWGYSDVIQKIPFYLKALKKIEKIAIEKETKVAILIDFQEFNLKLAQKLSKKGVKILYYVAPQAWVWKSYRVKILEKYVHTLFTILPFEKEWFTSRGVKKVISVKHPLWPKYREELSQWDSSENFYQGSEKLRILLLPGSRNFEVKYLLPEFIKVIKKLKSHFDIEIGIVESTSVNIELYRPFHDLIDRIFSSDELTDALKTYHFCFAASGTVTLSTALFLIPTIVCYRGSPLNEFVFQSFVKYTGPISLANIVHQDYIFPEHIQDLANSFEIYRTFCQWILCREKYDSVRKKLEMTQKYLQGEKESVAEYMAKIIIESK